MRRVLSSWALFGVVWVGGQALVDLLVRRHVDATAAALWTAAVVTAAQALAVESLASPLGLVVFLRGAGRTLRRPASLALWSLAALALLAAWWWLDGGLAPLAMVRIGLAVAAALSLAIAAWRQKELAAVRGPLLTLSTLVMLTASDQVLGWLAVGPRRLLPVSARAADLIALLLVLSMLYAALFRAQSRVAKVRATAASWLGAAAGIGTLGLAAKVLPWSLSSSPGPDLGAWLAAALLLGATLCLSTAGLSMIREPA